MTDISGERADAIQKLSELARVLYEALDRQNSEQILSAQQNLGTAAEMVWTQAASDPDISSKDKAIVRLLADAAIKELPVVIQDPANYPKIKQQLRLLKASLVLLK
ncbi:MAG: hypothetical protein EHM70_04810 [Chloroflexota bacterium]|nr:MAG: hypothetical protein EHM70_04810 [Chloroflexota bacterium]